MSCSFKEPPTPAQFEEFKRICSHFFEQHPGEIIGQDAAYSDYKSLPHYNSAGVHCTHGYNRTGFLIISYLVEVEDWR